MMPGEAERAYAAADLAAANERTLFNEAIKLSTFATPRINGCLIKASHLSKPVRGRSDELDLAIAFTADLLDKLTALRTRLGWHKRGDRA